MFYATVEGHAGDSFQLGAVYKNSGCMTRSLNL